MTVPAVTLRCEDVLLDLLQSADQNPVVQAPRQLKTLDDLLAQAVHYATFCMRNSGKMAPTLFLIGADGPLMFATGSLADEDEKDAFATNARLLCIACAATACVMALESWMNYVE